MVVDFDIPTSIRLVSCAVERFGNRDLTDKTTPGPRCLGGRGTPAPKNSVEVSCQSPVDCALSRPTKLNSHGQHNRVATANPTNDAPVTTLLTVAYGLGILDQMPDSTTIRVTRSTRDALKHLAEDDGLTHDEELARLLRSERQRRMGASLTLQPTTEGRAWIEAGMSTMGRHAGR